MNKNHLFLLLILLTFGASAQGPLERSVQVSAVAQNNPPHIDFSWAWDYSGPEYNIYRKTPDAPTWGEPIATLEWWQVEWTDNDVEIGVPYEYAFFKRGWENIRDTICVETGTEVTFNIQNIYGDGLCCNFGFGSYEVRACNQVFASGSDFGAEANTTFTVCGEVGTCENVYITITPDMLPNNTFWSLKNTATGAVIIDSGEPYTNLAERAKYGFIYTGITVPPIEERGTILLLTDAFLVDSLANEIQQLQEDFQADGWRTKELKIQRSLSVEEVKNKIRTINAQTDDLTAVLLLGHIPVPYAGAFYADGHSENHWGAWAADVYYADLDGVWTDNTVMNVSSFFSRNHNVPGDGKFDQSALPSPADLQIGRVDFFNMPAFGKTEIELTRQYLQKNHLFKTGQRTVERRALIDDNLGIVLGAPAASAWRNFAPMFGAEQLVEADYFSTMKNESYLWSYGGGSGTHQSANGVGTTDDFANHQLKNIFTMLIGSQFGDWDNVDNFLRAPLASEGWTLTSCWVGNPPWTLHHMAQGFNIGYSLQRTQNASINNYNPGPQLVHTSLLGDPTLRLHPVAMPQDVKVMVNETDVTLVWEAAADPTVIGYYVYRQNPVNLKFERLTYNLITGTKFIDANPRDLENVYLVKSVKLEKGGSGTYYNLSLGARATAEFLTPIFECCPTNSSINRWTISPNPTTGTITINTSSEERKKYLQPPFQIEIYDVLGQLLYKELVPDMSNVELDLSTFSEGVYVVKVGEESEKLVINRY